MADVHMSYFPPEDVGEDVVAEDVVLPTPVIDIINDPYSSPTQDVHVVVDPYSTEPYSTEPFSTDLDELNRPVMDDLDDDDFSYDDDTQNLVT